MKGKNKQCTYVPKESNSKTESQNQQQEDLKPTKVYRSSSKSPNHFKASTQKFPQQSSQKVFSNTREKKAYNKYEKKPAGYDYKRKQNHQRIAKERILEISDPDLSENSSFAELLSQYPRFFTSHFQQPENYLVNIEEIKSEEQVIVNQNNYQKDSSHHHYRDHKEHQNNYRDHARDHNREPFQKTQITRKETKQVDLEFQQRFKPQQGSFNISEEMESKRLKKTTLFENDKMLECYSLEEQEHDPDINNTIRELEEKMYELDMSFEEKKAKPKPREVETPSPQHSPPKQTPKQETVNIQDQLNKFMKGFASNPKPVEVPYDPAIIYSKVQEKPPATAAQQNQYQSTIIQYFIDTHKESPVKTTTFHPPPPPPPTNIQPLPSIPTSFENIPQQPQTFTAKQPQYAFTNPIYQQPIIPQAPQQQIPLIYNPVKQPNPQQYYYQMPTNPQYYDFDCQQNFFCCFATANNLSPQDLVWYYIDTQKVNQGPFSSEQMDQWNMQNFFSDSLQIAISSPKDFITLKVFYQDPQQLAKKVLLYFQQQYQQQQFLQQQQALRQHLIAKQQQENQKFYRQQMFFDKLDPKNSDF